jgi:O-antigen/teichoic acid export membrane protein
VDQVLSSGTNFVPTVLLARLLGPAVFGAFSLAILAWFSALALLRAALMQPYTLAAASLEGEEWQQITSHAGGVVLVGGVATGCVFATMATLVGTSSSLGQALLAVAVLAPGMALQEFWRVASFAAQRARTATANDGLWAIGQVAAFAVLLWSGKVTVAGGMLAWGAPATVAAALGVLQLSVIPKVGVASAHWAKQWIKISAWFTATSAAFTLGYLIIAVIVSAKIGNVGLGLFRTVQQNLFGPVQLLTIGGASVFVPHLVRAIKRTATTAVRESMVYSLVMVSLVGAYGGVLLITDRTILTRVFGTAFVPATVVVLPMLISFTLDAASSGAALLLRAQAKGGRLLIAQMTSTSARVIAVAILVSIAGLRGAGWGLVIGSGITVFVMWTQVVLATTRKRWRPDSVEPSLSIGLQLAESDGGAGGR